MTGMINQPGWPTQRNMTFAGTSEDLHLYEYMNTGKGADMSGRDDWVGIRASAEASLGGKIRTKDTVYFAGKDTLTQEATLLGVH